MTCPQERFRNKNTIIKHTYYSMQLYYNRYFFVTYHYRAYITVLCTEILSYYRYCIPQERFKDKNTITLLFSATILPVL